MRMGFLGSLLDFLGCVLEFLGCVYFLDVYPSIYHQNTKKKYSLHSPKNINDNTTPKKKITFMDTHILTHGQASQFI